MTIDTESTDYARFVMHLRYLTARVEDGVRRDDGIAPMLETMKGAYPEAWAVTCAIIGYFHDELEWDCDENEALYLLIHVQRLKTALGA